MGEVVAFKPVERTATGPALCIQCRHEWIATAPIGEVNLECPSCTTMKGLWKFPYDVPEGQMRRVCNCGNDLFKITPDGHVCANCGSYQNY